MLLHDDDDHTNLPPHLEPVLQAATGHDDLPPLEPVDTSESSESSDNDGAIAGSAMKNSVAERAKRAAHKRAITFNATSGKATSLLTFTTRFSWPANFSTAVLRGSINRSVMRAAHVVESTSRGAVHHHSCLQVHDEASTDDLECYE